MSARGWTVKGRQRLTCEQHPPPHVRVYRIYLSSPPQPSWELQLSRHPKRGQPRTATDGLTSVVKALGLDEAGRVWGQSTHWLLHRLGGFIGTGVLGVLLSHVGLIKGEIQGARSGTKETTSLSAPGFSSSSISQGSIVRKWVFGASGKRANAGNEVREGPKSKGGPEQGVMLSKRLFTFSCVSSFLRAGVG